MKRARAGLIPQSDWDEAEKTYRTITITNREAEVLGYIQDIAFGDQEGYLSVGNPNTDYGGEWPFTAQTKARDFRDVGRLAARLKFRGERKRWSRLAKNFEASGREYQQDHEEVQS